MGWQRYEFDGPTIVYTLTRKLVEELYAFLVGLGITVGMYHAGRPEAERHKVHHDFVHDKIQVRFFDSSMTSFKHSRFSVSLQPSPLVWASTSPTSGFNLGEFLLQSPLN